MKTDHKFGGRTTSRFDGSRRHYHKPFRDDPDNNWDEWTGDKARGPFREFLGSLFQMMGTLVVGAIVLVVVFLGISFFWKLIFPMIGK